MVLGNAAGALLNMTRDVDSLPQMVQEGCVPPIIKLLAGAGAHDNKVLANAAQALRNISQHDACRSVLVQEGAVQPLVQLCLKSIDGKVLVCAALALAGLTVQEFKAVESVAGVDALNALTRVEKTLGEHVPPYLSELLQEAIEALKPKASFDNYYV
jgi:HEAT repeat protein